MRHAGHSGFTVTVFCAAASHVMAGDRTGCDFAWSPLAGGVTKSGGLPGSVKGMTRHVENGAATLIVWGDFEFAGGVAVSGLARWDGAEWSALPALPDAQRPAPPTILAWPVSVDPDYDGPVEASLFLGGMFWLAWGGPFIYSPLLTLNGSAWQSAEGIDSDTYHGGEVTRMWVAAPDGAANPSRGLIIQGKFALEGGGPFSEDRFAMWDGTSWMFLNTMDDENFSGVFPPVTGSGVPMLDGAVAVWSGWNEQHAGLVALQADFRTEVQIGNNLTDLVRIAVHDSGDGPRPYGVGDFDAATPFTGQLNGVAQLIDGLWWPLGAGLWLPTGGPGAGADVTSFVDHNGAGLFVCGNFTEAGRVPAKRVACWRKDAWHAVGADMDAVAADLEVFDDGWGDALIVAGDFVSAGGQLCFGIARYGPPRTPVVAEAPVSQAVDAGDPVTFEVDATGEGRISYQWSRDGVELVDDGRISGSQSETLQIDPALATDAGEYRVRLSDSCGTFESKPALLSVGCVAPDIVAASSDVALAPGATLVLSIEPAGSPPFAFEWAHDGEPLQDGGGVSGSATATLAITPVGYPDAGTYSVTVTNACNSDSAQAEVVIVLPGDLNGDTKVDGSDLGLMLALWGPNPLLPAADLNQDDVVDGADLGILLSNWG